MASLVLGAVGTALGGQMFGMAPLIFGLTGGQIGGMIGSSLGSFLDGALFGSGGANVKVGKIEDLRVQASREGAAVSRVYGRARVAGQIIWATEFREKKKTKKVGGGKGGGSGGGGTVTEFSYFANFAVGLCEGPIRGIGKVWADGNPLDLGPYTTWLYTGNEVQTPDSLIESVEGMGKAPAYRGMAYIVFDDLPLEKFGNRVPQLNFEVFRALSSGAGGGSSLEDQVRGVTLAPQGGEFGLGTQVVDRDDGDGLGILENMFNGRGIANFLASRDRLADDLPNVESVALQVAWTGEDLRCNSITFKPAIDRTVKNTDPYTWEVNGVTRANARLLTSDATGVLLQGTPADAAVVEAIAELKTRGDRVVFVPLVQLDIPSGNMLDDPYDPGTYQPINPWRGRMTCDPAPGVAGTVDKTATASSQVDSFFGTAAPSDFSVSGTSVAWTGGVDWGYRRMVLHYAKLCGAAGGVDAFLIGSQLGGMTRIRSAAQTYPTVAKLKTLAADVSTVLGAGTKVSYAANWGEYHSYAPNDGSNDLDFFLDDLWSDSNIDFVAIDNYMPLTDWRDGANHLDHDAGWTGPYDIDYLKAGIKGGEEFDWYYADTVARDAQTRTTIIDPLAPTHDEPWVFAVKDLRSWWQNAHYGRPGGVRDVSATGWAAESKPIWFTELGCPAVDKGANRPGLVFDVLSDDSALPPYSTGARDDLIQRRFLEAHHEFWSEAANNPTSTVYSGKMVDTDNMHVSQWDPRPYPDFPRRSNVWRDTANWRTGRWVSGRVGGSGLGALVSALCSEVGFSNIDVSGLRGSVAGYVLDQLLSPRDAIAPLSLAYQFDAAETGGIIRFFHRDQDPAGSLAELDLVEPGRDEPQRFKLTRGQETELPLVAKMTFLEDGGDYQPGTAEFRRQTVSTDRVVQTEMPLVIDADQAQGVVDTWLMDLWAQRERLEAHLAPSDIRFDPGDVVSFTLNGRNHTMRVTEVSDTYARGAKAVGTEKGIYSIGYGTGVGGRVPTVPIYRRPIFEFLDLPLMRGSEAPHAPHVASNVVPWPGAIALYRSPATSDFELDTMVGAPASMGTTLNSFIAGPTGRIDYANKLQVRVGFGELSSTPLEQVLSGANVAAIKNPSGEWELIQFLSATLTGTKTYELAGLLRGQFGTENAMVNSLAAGARFVLIDAAVVQTSLTLNERQLDRTWTYGPSAVGISHRSFKSETRSFSGVGLRPYSPVHVKGDWQANDDIDITWVRRSRIGGDEWERDEIPLGENSEGYEIDAMNGGTVVRTTARVAANWTYTDTQQIADFGSVQSSITIRIYQISEIYGRGARREVVLNG
ncbi:glycoside hydrolase/phage tail family protein [bacterium AH-315-P15]|nr:glycoside hydrolase/phage tail family protein [bacterium AH-315-P15]